MCKVPRLIPTLLALEFPVWGLTQPSIPQLVGKVSASNEGDWWNMCFLNRFTVPRGSLEACMLPKELRWEEEVLLIKE